MNQILKSIEVLRSIEKVLDEGFEVSNPRIGTVIKKHDTFLFTKRYMVFNRGVWFGPKTFGLSIRIFNNQNL